MGHPTCRAEGPRTRGWGEGEGQAGRPGRATAKWVERLPSPQRDDNTEKRQLYICKL